MKHRLILLFVALFTCKVSAQKQATLDRVIKPPPPKVNIEDASKNIGKLVTVDGYLYSYKKLNPKQICLIIIDKASYHSMQILIEGNDIKLNSSKLKGAYGF